MGAAEAVGDAQRKSVVFACRISRHFYELAVGANPLSESGTGLFALTVPRLRANEFGLTEIVRLIISRMTPVFASKHRAQHKAQA